MLSCGRDRVKDVHCGAVDEIQYHITGATQQQQQHDIDVSLSKRTGSHHIHYRSSKGSRGECTYVYALQDVRSPQLYSGFAMLRNQNFAEVALHSVLHTSFSVLRG